MFARLGRSGRRLVWGGALTGLLLAAGTTAIGDVSPEAKRARGQNDSFSLFAGPTAVLTGNQLQCGLNNQGYICTDVFDSPTGGGGFWPVGSPNAYIFNTGLQIAGIIQEDGGPWANDTTAAFFFDPKGTTQHGSARTNIYDSLNPDDLANWPDEARIQDGDPLFQPILWGRDAASQQDSWVKYWDGDPARISGREHPLGIEVEQRSLAWNYPAGNESLIYFIYKFENVTDAEDFRRLNNTQFFGGDDALPVDGYTIGELYGAFGTDMDVSDATENFSTAVLPFDVGISYTGGFNAPEFSYTPDIFFPPFFTNAPGLIGIKYLRSPIRPGSDPPEEVGLTLFSANLNASFGFPDPQNDKQLWRYLSGKINPAQGDNPCNVEPEVQTADPNTTERSVCFIYQESADTRFYQSSGPFILGPDDEPATIVVAYIAAATVQFLPDGTESGILVNQADANANPPGDPSFHPGFTSARGCTPAAISSNDLTGCTDVRTDNPVKPIEKGAGWVESTETYPGDNPGRLTGLLEAPDNKLDQFQVVVVPNSLLGRALVAQSIFDSSFLLGFAPDNPAFYLVPGDNNVTVIWEPSPTEELGDPFYQVASDETSPLFNPNYREFDVEGYRVWRGQDPGALGLIAQFDKDNSTFVDYTCETVAPDEDVGTIRDVDGTPTAVIGYVAGEVCDADFTTDTPIATRAINSSMIFNNGSDGGLPGAGVARLADLSAIAINLTNVVVDDPAGEAALALDTGIPFFYVDNDVTNNFTYFYAVSSFDVNSQASGPHSLRSARVAQSTVPRADAPNLQGASLLVAFSGDDGEPLNANAPMPSLDPEDGTFSGPMPPTDELTLSFAPLLPRLLPQLQLQVVIDSVTTVFDPASDEETPTAECPLGGTSFAVCNKVWMSYTDIDGNPQSIVGDALVGWWSAFGTSASVPSNWVSLEIPFDQDALDAFGIPAASGLATADVVTAEAINHSQAEGPQNRRFYGNGLMHGGSRWFAGENETEPDPTRYMRVGTLPGVDTIFSPIGYTPFDENMPTTPSGGALGGGTQIDFEKQCHARANAMMGRAADIVFTWGEGGSVTVRDVTHNVDVPFTGFPDATYGFIQDANGNGVIDWQDFNGMLRVWDQINDESIFGGGDCNGFDGGDLQTNIPTPLAMQQTATLSTVHVDDFEYGWADPANGASTWSGTGSGFGLYVTGQRFIFQLSELPPAGTVWTLRSYSGAIRTSGTDGVADPSGYTFSPTATNASSGRNVLIPGLTMNWLVEDATNFDGATDLTQVHTVPDPYLATSQYDLSPTAKQLMFVNLPPVATIRIYTLTGILVDIVNHDDVTGGGRAVWNLRNRNNQFVASGVYFFHVVTPEGDTHVGKFTVVNFGAQN
jgi:hypothetical protein